jgi:hypothetical protein
VTLDPVFGGKPIRLAAKFSANNSVAFLPISTFRLSSFGFKYSSFLPARKNRMWTIRGDKIFLGYF